MQGDPIMITTRDMLERVGDATSSGSMELADNFYYGVNITPLMDPHPHGLSELPKPYDSGWWPITNFDFTKQSLKSKSIPVPFTTINLPMEGERPSGIKLTVVDDSRRSFQTYLQNYLARVFNFNANVVLGYKDVSWRIAVYQYDRSYTTMYCKVLIGVISDYTDSFIGTDSHTVSEFNIDFSVVGEILTDRPTLRDMRRSKVPDDDPIADFDEDELAGTNYVVDGSNEQKSDDTE